MTRILAICGWSAWQITRRIDATPLRRIGGRRVVMAMVALLLVAGAAPVASAYAQPQPQDVVVDEIFNGEVTDPAGWVRLRGRLVTLQEPPSPDPGQYGLLVDAENALRAVVVRSAGSITPEAATTVSGHLMTSTIVVTEDLPLEATVFGTPPRIVAEALVQLDPIAHPARVVLWPVALALAFLALVLVIGLRTGYPFFRATREVDVLSRPLGPGDRVPAAISGQVGRHEMPLHDPAEALLVAGRGARGPILMVQLLANPGAAPAPVPIGGGWSTGTVGYVHTVTETLPALAVRAEDVDAVVMFARVSERDRAAVMVGAGR